jgi:hypothetical protein
MHQELEDYIVGLVYSHVPLVHWVSCRPERYPRSLSHSDLDVPPFLQ